MVNFRFHLVSLTAVFLALAAGITIGAGVVDRATVDQIERQLSDVAKRREATNAENDQLREDLAQWGRFSEEAGDQLVVGLLTDVPVVIVATSGVDRNLVDGFSGALTTAGAAVDGTFWFTGQWVLDDPERARQLAGILDVAPTTGADALRAAGIAAIAAAWETGDGGALVDAMTKAGFLEVIRPAPPTTGAEPVAPEQLPRPDSLFVVISGDDAEVPPTALGVPLVTRLAAAGRPVLAAQPQRPPAADGTEVDDEPAPEFVPAVRAATVSARLSSVDNLQDYRGRIGAVLALRDLRLGRTGHYGFGPDTRLVPEPPAG